MLDGFGVRSFDVFRGVVGVAVTVACVACGAPEGVTTDAPSEPPPTFARGEPASPTEGATGCVPSGGGELGGASCAEPASASPSAPKEERALPPDVCSPRGVGGLKMKLVTSEAVAGTVIDAATSKPLCTFEAAPGSLVVDLAFFAGSSCPIPTSGARWSLQLVGATSHGTSKVGLSYGAGAVAGTGVSVDYLGDGVRATGSVPLRHFWVNNVCDGDITITGDAPIGAAPPGVPLEAVEITIGAPGAAPITSAKGG